MAARRNIDITYIVMNNEIYGLTTGQVSPTSIKGMKTKSTPFGSVENPVNPIPLAIAGGATYVARGFTGQVRMIAPSMAKYTPTSSEEGLLTRNMRMPRKHSANHADGGVQSQLAASIRMTPTRLPSRLRKRLPAQRW